LHLVKGSNFLRNPELIKAMRIPNYFEMQKSHKEKSKKMEKMHTRR